MNRFQTLAALAVAALPLQRATAQNDLTTEVVASGLSSALFVTAAPGDSTRLFVVEQGGTIWIVNKNTGSRLPTPFLDRSSRIRGGGERGLLGLAFPTDYLQTGVFYISYTRQPDGASVVERLTVSSNPNVADPNSGQIVIGPISQPFGNHNGGCIQFGPDGYLYFGVGDGGSANDPGCRAQNGNTLLGKMLRYDVSTAAASVPASNPFVGDPGFRDEIWAYGLRNPWRFSFDQLTGDLFIGDVGQNEVEEIDYQPASSTGGENYGWKVKEGSRCFSTSACAPGTPSCSSNALVDPISEYSHSFGCSVTGGVVYRGDSTDLQGTYFYGDFCSGIIWSFRVVNGVRTDFQRETRLGTFGNLTSFGNDNEGEVYIVQRNTVRRITVPTPSSRNLGFGTPGANGIPPLFSMAGLLTPGASAEFRLDLAAGNAPAALALGVALNPTPFANIGTLVMSPVVSRIPFVTNALGQIRFTVPGGAGMATVYAQFLIQDAGAAGGVALSNGLEVFVF